MLRPPPKCMRAFKGHPRFVQPATHHCAKPLARTLGR